MGIHSIITPETGTDEGLPICLRGIDITTTCTLDRQGDHYLLLLVGRDGIRRVHGCLIHVDIIQGKIWIQRDGTEQGIGRDLVAARVPKDQIVLAFRSPEMRQYVEFAVA